MEQLTVNSVSIAMTASTFADSLAVGSSTAHAIELSFNIFYGFHFMRSHRD
jgi:hypothetical protein